MCFKYLSNFKKFIFFKMLFIKYLRYLSRYAFLFRYQSIFFFKNFVDTIIHKTRIICYYKTRSSRLFVPQNLFADDNLYELHV